MNGKKIVIISKKFPPDYDGVGDHSYQLAQRLKKDGFLIELITSAKYTNSDFKHYISNLNGYRCVHELKKIIQASKPNTVLFQYVPFSYNQKGLPFWLIPFFIYLKQQNIQILFFVHETYERRRAKLKHRLLELLQKSILFSLCRTSNVVFTTNTVYAKQLEKFKNKLYITRTPSNFEPIHIEARLKYEEKNSDSLNLVYFGNRDLKKPLGIFKELYTLNKNTTLTILGKIHPDFLSEIHRKEHEYLRQNIHVSGTLAPNDLVEAISKASAYLLPEYVGIKGDGGLNTKSGTTATGFMLGKIVISTKGDMTESFFEDMKNCILIDINDPKNAAKKIFSVLTDNAMINEIETGSQQLYEHHLSWINTINIITEPLLYANPLEKN